MKATGIVRRIDDLGRVVIPKEIRRSLRIREGEPLEIFTNEEGGVVFQKYSPVGEFGEFTAQYAEALHKTAGFPVAICDLDNVIAAAGVPKKEYLEKPITSHLSGILETHRPYSAGSGDPVDVVSTASGTDTNGVDASGTGHRGMLVSYLSPIVSEGNVVGAVMALSDSPAPPDETAKKLINTGALFLSSQMQI
ncbi:MAG: AbrB/MazE/SpoVT family DNA-binding domain-containing protein [Oscillospiraceae bacterium]|nr:AbrB/MazE/SpoVT family DNA-binding domain-containing protein [Oscillospiraceae bacterium]